ncbi:hypothetical protein [Brevifollis gellanilyticus]|uniref:Lipoprotein n=1 Tax=Brevifollis gellanilyticus TaxID=748831 RepID=A0A512M816_9BACT|nr:hypothetical protein [Brevifollis gellanilyticus]GEP42865.1 hypothetical protein BGE01nite_21560 [Brevifollis gellanilyticus]
MRRSTFLCLLALGLSSALNAEIPLDDSTIIVGERVGPIEKGMTLFGLKTMFGGGKVKSVKIPGAEGEEIDGVRLFGGTDREIEIIFNPEGDEKEIWDVRIIGKGWKFVNGLTKKMGIAELEKVNGKPYQVNGFGWDYGGWANFEGGKLEGKVSIRFSPEGDVDDSLNGDKQIPSTNKKLRAAKVSMTDISVSLR